VLQLQVLMLQGRLTLAPVLLVINELERSVQL